jgi:hypothetical protein
VAVLIDPAKRQVMAIQCKDLALARTPQELSSQLEGLMGEAERSQGVITTRHSRRVNWVGENLAGILAHLGVITADGWLAA